MLASLPSVGAGSGRRRASTGRPLGLRWTVWRAPGARIVGTAAAQRYSLGRTEEGNRVPEAPTRAPSDSRKLSAVLVDAESVSEPGALPMPLRVLAEAKAPFALRDYQSHFEATSRIMASISSLRNWQLTATGGLAYLTKGVPILPAATVVVLVWGMFLTLECAERAGFRLVQREVLDRERRLHATSAEDWWQNLATWEFGNASVAKWTQRERLISTLKSLRSPALQLWHGTLFVVLFTLLLYIR